MELSPLVYEVGVACDPGHAFAVWTSSPTSYDAGDVVVREEGTRLVHAWTPGHPPGHPSRVTVTFEPREGGCTVRLEHGGWDAENAHLRGRSGDWPTVLWSFATRAETAEAPAGVGDTVIGVVTRLTDALRGRRADDAVGCFTEDGVLFGSGAGERAEGAGELRAFLDRLLSATYTVGWELETPVARQDGDLVWFVAPAVLEVRHDDGRSDRLAYRVSGVLRLTGGGWRLELLNGAEPAAG
jgi:ketosteroid isomerase-like protein